MASNRFRNFATVVYPESAPEDWKRIIADQLVPCFISPLHDQDENPDGEHKKPHYHVLLMFDGVKTVEQAKELFDLIGGVGCEICKSLRGYARYLCHLDNPDKHQYDVADVVQYGGADFADVIGLPIDRYVAIGEMVDFVIEHQIKSYAELLVFSRQNNQSWFRILCDSGTVVMKEFIKSNCWLQSQASNE